MQSLGNILNFKAKRSAVMKGVLGALAVETADKILIGIFGEKAKESCRTTYLKNRVLTIACLSSVMAQEIRLRECQIIKAINEKLGSREVEKIKYLA